MGKQSLVEVTTQAPAHESENKRMGDRNERPFPPHLMLIGLLIVALFTGSLAVWASLAPIEGAVVSRGIVTVSGFRKQVQHLEGGIVEQIRVRDGERVAKGEVLVQLRDVKPAAELRHLEGQYIEVQATVARLLAERDNRVNVEFPQELLARSNDPSVRAALSGQASIFKTRNAVSRDKESMLEQKITQAREQIKGLLDRKKIKTRQKKLVLEELAIFEEAIERKVVPKTKGLELQHDLTECEDDLIDYQSQIGQLQQSILELQLQISEAREQRLAGIKEELSAQRALQFELSQKIITARDVLDRTKVLAPIDGVVVNLQIHSRGGVVEPGKPLMEIVPAGDELVVDAFVNPVKIDEVWAGMPADVRLATGSRRERLPVKGVVSNISADRLTDEQTGEDYYRARIQLLPESLASSNIKLLAGMGADVYLRTEPRTALDYLLSPITKSLGKGMREK